MGGIFVEGELPHLAVRDLTMETDVPLDIRGKASASFERVRMRGFDVGAGGSSALYVGGDAYIACDGCEINGGFGRDPGRGYAVTFRGRALVLMRNCLLSRMRHAVALEQPRVAKGSRIRFEECIFERSGVIYCWNRNQLAEFPFALELARCRFVWSTDKLSEKNREITLGLDLATSREGLKFESVPPLFALGDLLAFLKALPSVCQDRVLGVEVIVKTTASEPMVLAVLTLPEAADQASQDERLKGVVSFFRWGPGGALERIPPDSRRRYSISTNLNFQHKGPLPSLPAMAAVLEGQGKLSRDREISSVCLESVTGKGPIYWYTLEMEELPDRWAIDASTGNIIRSPPGMESSMGD